MKILVLGGTGAIGTGLVELLAQNNNSIYVTSRSARKGNENITYVQGNAMDISFLGTVLKQFHWDCIVDFMAYTQSQFKDRIDMLLEATEQYIFLSSARVYDYDQQPITEESKRILDTCKDRKYLLSNDYALEKAREENCLTTNAKHNWTIIRPYKTYSNKRLQLGFLEKESWLYRCLQGRKIVFSKDLASKYTSLSHTSDVAKSIVALIGNKQSYGEIYQVITGKQVTWNEVLQIYVSIIEELTGKRPDIYMGEQAYAIWRGRPDYTIEYDSLKDHYFQNDKIINLIKNNESIEFKDLEDGLRECLSEFMNATEFKRINWMQEAYMDKLTHERADMKEISSMKDRMIYLLVRYTHLFSVFKLVRKLKY